MKRLLSFALAASFTGTLWAARGDIPAAAEKRATEDELLESGCQLFRETTGDKVAAIKAFEMYLQEYEGSRRAVDAQFIIGEAYLNQALKILEKEAESKKTRADRLMAPKNTAAVNALNLARGAFEKVVARASKKDPGLRASAQYRLGEVAYNAKDWGLAIEGWRGIEKEFHMSYIVPEAWMGIIFANLALEQFALAVSNLFLLGEAYPHYLKVPEVQYAQGIVSLHKGDYTNAEAAFKRVNTAEAQFYLGKTYLLSKRPYLAAAAFERIVRDFQDSILREETEFFIGDSFFLAKDFDGAITKYQRFLMKYPESQLRVSTLFRIGSSHFQKKNYMEARAHFQSVIDRYPTDFYAPLAQYFIAESYLVDNQFREALFAYTKVITQHPETIKISPMAHYKLAWAQYQVNDYAQAAQTCRNFLSLYPTNALAKNVYLLLGNALLDLKRHDDAVTAFQRVIDLAPTSDVAEQALLTILRVAHDRKDYNSILTSYQFIFRHLPPSQSKWRPLSYLYAAEAYLALNRVDEAKAIYEMVMKVYPNDQAAFYAQDGLAWTHSMMGNDDRALSERQKLKDMMRLARTTYTFSGTNELGIADSMYNRKEYEDAYQLYDKFAAENPNGPRAPEALYRSGMALYNLRYYTQAIETWTKLRESYPKSPEAGKAEYQIGDTLFRAQKYAESAEQYKRIIQLYPKSDQLPLAYLRVAMSCYNALDDAATLSAALAMLSKYPDAPEATDALDLMEAVYDRNKGADFRKSLGAVIDAVPGSSVAGEARFRIGRRLFEMKQYAEAAAEFQKFSVDYTGNPKLKKAQFLLGESYFSAERNSDAILAFGRFLENFPKSEDTALALFHLATAHYNAKQYEEAIANYKRLLDEYPQSEYAKASQFNLAMVYKAEGKLAEAQEAYSRYIVLAGSDDKTAKAALWEVFGLQKDRKQYAAALETLGRILEGQPATEDLFEGSYRRGEIYVLMSRADDATRSWESVVALTPKNNPYRLKALIDLGQAYEKTQDYSKAAGVYADLAANASTKQMADAARERAEICRRQMKAPPKPEAVPGEEGRKTQVMPEDKSAPAAPPKKKGKNKEPAQPQKINIPGMN